MGQFSYVLLVAILIAKFATDATAATLFSDDFESGNLNNWTVGGRQLVGTNTANTVSRHGSTMGHLYKTSFTEITLEKSFTYDPLLGFDFDMEVTAFSQPAPSAFYASSGVDFTFTDSGGNSLGYVFYAHSTTSYLMDLVSGDATAAGVELLAGRLQHHSLDVSDMLSLITIDESMIDSVAMRFRTYSSTAPYPSTSAELWLDNVNINNDVRVGAVPLPPSAALLGFGLAGMGLFGRWRHIRAS